MSRAATWTCELSCFAGETLVANLARVSERVDQPYVIDLEVTIDRTPIDTALVLGADCILRVERPDQSRQFLGVVREVRTHTRAISQTALRLTVVPALALLALRRDTRIFQEEAAPDVIERVLSEGLAPYGREVMLDMREAHPVRDYLLQYQESDLDFVHRLMEEEGISYAFETDGEVERLVLFDVSSTCSDVETFDGSGALIFDPRVFELGDSENVYSLRRVMKPTTGMVASRGRDFTQNRRVDGSHDDPDGRPDREDFVHLRGRLLRDDGESTTYVKRGLESVRARAIEIRAGGRAIGLTPGRHIELSGHPMPGLDDRYFVTEVVHTSAPIGDGAPTDGYTAQFVAAPSSVPWRPLRVTPKPRVGSIETATVVGSAGEEIETDEHGRIKVQFHWDRHGQSDEHSSCWVRVRQAWAGLGWGFVFIPRIGMEVIVTFLEGDPDRPVCMGCLYNADNPPPYPLPDEKTKSTIKTNSSPGGGGFNEWRYEDLAGSEQIFSHAQKDQDEVVLNDHTTTVGHDQKNEVTGSQTQKIGQHQTETIDVDQDMTVFGKRTVEVTGKFDETVKGAEARTVIGGVTETISGGEKRLVTDGLTETRIGDETELIFSGLEEISLGDLTQTVVGNVGELVLAAETTTAVGAVTVFTPATAAFTGTGMLQIMAGGTMTILAPPQLQWNTSARTEFQASVTESKGFGIGITGLNISTAGSATGMAAVSIEKVSVKIEAWGAQVGVVNLALSLVGAEASVTGININIGAFRMENAGLDVKA